MKIARSGYSKQGGFELYLMDQNRGSDLWNIVREAGARWNIGPGNLNPVERIEGGLLSYGGDTDDNTNPYEVRLGKYVDLELPVDVIGIEALREIHMQGPLRHQLGVKLDDEEPQPGHAIWYEVTVGGKPVGHMTNGGFSRRFGCMIGYVLISRECNVGDPVMVHKNDAQIPGTLCDIPFR